MSVHEVKQALGSWDLRLKKSTPRAILDALDPFGHIVVLPGRVSPKLFGDNLLRQARYVGVYRGRRRGQEHALKGCGMEFWLGDEDGKGHVILGPLSASGATFADSIRMLLPDSVSEGTLHSVPGTFTNTFRYTNPRTAITYVTDSFSSGSNLVSWRVNGDGTLDAGLDSDLYVTVPRAILVAKTATSKDLTMAGVPGRMGLEQDVEDYTTEVILVAEGEGTSIVTASASNPTPYNDLFGQDVVLTRFVSESTTEAGNAAARAQLQLNRFSLPRYAVTLSTDKYDVTGTFQVGDTVAVYDPDTGFVDAANSRIWEGQPINPIHLPVTDMTWPVEKGWTVAFRRGDGTYLDLSEHYIPESGAATIGVGAFNRALTGIGTEPIGTRPSADSSTPATPVLNPIQTVAYQSAASNDVRAAVYLTWNQPLNTDGSTVLDGSHYEIRYRTVEVYNYPVTWSQAAGFTWSQLQTWGRPLSNDAVVANDWNYVIVPWGQESVTINELMVAAEYEFQIRAVDAASPPHNSAWSATIQQLTSSDTIAPGTPAAPEVSASLIAVQVVHRLGLASGGEYNLPQDLHHLEVHVGGPAFYPDETTRLGTIVANAGHLAAQTPVVATFTVSNTEEIWVKVVAVDRFGNRSSGSEAVQASAILIDSAHISDLTASKITAGTITADLLISGSIKTAESGQRAELNQLGLQLYDADGELTVNLTADDDTPNFISITDGYQNTLASIDQDGNIQGQIGTFTDVVVDGQALLGERLPLFEKGTVAYGLIGPPSPPNPASLPYGIMQLAFQAEEGRSYQLNVRANMAVLGGVNGQESPGIRVWDCGDVDTGSETGTLVMFANHVVNNTGQGETVSDSGFLLEPTAGRHQLYAQMYRNSGSGTIYIGNTEMWVKDMGPTIVNTGQANYGTSGSTSTPSVQTYTTSFLATAYQTYNGNNTQKSDTTANQGFYSSNQKSMIFFDYGAILAAINGSTIQSMTLTMYAEHWYYNAGGTAVIGTHVLGSAPGTYQSQYVTPDRIRSPGWPKPGWRTVDISSFANDFKTGGAVGIALGPGPDTSYTYYGKFTGSGANRPYITITYTK